MALKTRTTTFVLSQRENIILLINGLSEQALFSALYVTLTNLQVFPHIYLDLKRSVCSEPFRSSYQSEASRQDPSLLSSLFITISRVGPRTDNFTCRHTETERGDHDFCLSGSHYTDKDPTSREWGAGNEHKIP